MLFLFSNFIGKVASTAKEPRITRAFVRLVQEMWKGAYGSGGGSNHGVADPSGFRREMTVFAPKFGGYDQVIKQTEALAYLSGLVKMILNLLKNSSSIVLPKESLSLKKDRIFKDP